MGTNAKTGLKTMPIDRQEAAAFDKVDGYGIFDGGKRCGMKLSRQDGQEMLFTLPTELMAAALPRLVRIVGAARCELAGEAMRLSTLALDARANVMPDGYTRIDLLMDERVEYSVRLDPLLVRQLLQQLLHLAPQPAGPKLGTSH